MPKIKVVLVDDHTVLRQGLRALLSYSEDIDVVGEAQNGREAIEAVERLRPDVVLMDINMPIMNGIDATRAISERFPDHAPLLSSHSTRSSSTLFRSLKRTPLASSPSAPRVPRSSELFGRLQAAKSTSIP